MSKEFGPPLRNNFETSTYLHKKCSFEEAVGQIQQLRTQGKRVIVAQGVFDILHDGHVQFLREAKKQGDVLVVGLENDEAVRLNKGSTRPFTPLQERMNVLAELESVDFVFAFEDALDYSAPEDKERYIERYRMLCPDAVAVSSWDPYIDQIRERAQAAGVAIMPIYAKAKGLSTTRLLSDIGYE